MRSGIWAVMAAGSVIRGLLLEAVVLGVGGGGVMNSYFLK